MNEMTVEQSLLNLLASRMERLSADSRWAHRASGVRGQVLRMLDALESGDSLPPSTVQDLIEAAFEILREAAREML